MIRPDNEIQQDILDLLQHDIRIDANDLRVDVDDGNVHLLGSVPSLFEKITAGELAERVKYVVNVSNDLNVMPVLTKSDEELASDIRSKFVRDIRIAHPEHIMISVSNGTVTLTGTVPTALNKSEAASDAWSVPGVIDVHNDLTIIPTLERGDDELEAAVRGDLTRDPALDGRDINVDVRSGIVTLKGTVSNLYQKRVAENDAWGEPGVIDVNDELAVAFP